MPKRSRWVVSMLLPAAVLVGAGACAFEPQRDRAGVGEPQLSAAAAPTGASASPGPGEGGASPEPTTPAPPPKTVAPSPTRTSPPPSSGCPVGEKQREVETYLTQLGGFGPITVDGRQSATDCTAIKKFQQRYDVRPATGRAGSLTAEVARRLASTRTGDCQAGAGTTVCVNLTLQTLWIVRDGTVVLRPTVTRTGMRGYATPAGTYSINSKALKIWSVPWKAWLPYWQHFYNDMGLHETTTYIHDGSIGSHGCVNLLRSDAVKAYELAGIGTRVHLFGRRPGT